jgi:predicted Rossmann-fold nucleotide-binding protein
MAMASPVRFDQEADKLGAALPRGPRVVVIGSTSFWHEQSESTCTYVGRLLAAIPGLVLVTGGVEGVGETTGRSFFQARCEAGREPRVFHVLPYGEEAWDYGETHFAGSNMAERREVLARMAGVYLAVEGGPGTVHEAEVASARGAVVIPVGRSGGHSAVLY